MFCKKCGGEVGEQMAFCPKCGQEQNRDLLAPPSANVPAPYAYPVQFVAKRTDGMCIASLVLGICSVVFSPLGIVAGALAILFWRNGIHAVESNPYRTGRGMAVAGLVTGIAGAVFSITFWVLIAATGAA